MLKAPTAKYNFLGSRSVNAAAMTANAATAAAIISILVPMESSILPAHTAIISTRTLKAATHAYPRQNVAGSTIPSITEMPASMPIAIAIDNNPTAPSAFLGLPPILEATSIIPETKIAKAATHLYPRLNCSGSTFPSSVAINPMMAIEPATASIPAIPTLDPPAILDARP